MGLPPIRYFTERRIAAAAWRLATSDEEIADIATATGFANRFHFSRIFSRQLGCGPAAYRRSRQQAAPR